MRDVLIPEQLSLSPRQPGSIENDYTRFTDTPGDRLWITTTGEEWLTRRRTGEPIENIIASEPNYRRGAVELFFVLAERALQSDWQAAKEASMVGYPKTTFIGPRGAILIAQGAQGPQDP
jgi:hypothetical protein